MGRWFYSNRAGIFMPDSRKAEGDPYRPLLYKPCVSSLEHPALGTGIFFILALVCSPNIHRAPSEMHLHALGDVPGPWGYRTSSERLFWAAKRSACVLASPSRPRPLWLPPWELWPHPVTAAPFASVWLETQGITEERWLSSEG